MIQYKLIKEYPGSPKIGTIEWFKTDEFGSISSDKWEGLDFYNAHPEFWEKVEELDYEIVNYRDYKGQLFDHMVLGATINSVKRLSDGEVFSIGNKISFGHNYNGVITKMTLADANSNIKKGVWIHYEGGSCHSDIAVKLKTPLFTTEDGVVIFEGDKYYIISSDFRAVYCSTSSESDLEFKSFYTKEKAQEYVLLNKPMLSLQDLLNAWGVSDEIGLYKTSLMFKKFEAVAKSKL